MSSKIHDPSSRGRLPDISDTPLRVGYYARDIWTFDAAPCIQCLDEARFHREFMVALHKAELNGGYGWPDGAGRCRTIMASFIIDIRTYGIPVKRYVYLVIQ